MYLSLYESYLNFWTEEEQMNTVISSRFSVFSLLLVDILFDVPKCEFVLINSSLIFFLFSAIFCGRRENNVQFKKLFVLLTHQFILVYFFNEVIYCFFYIYQSNFLTYVFFYHIYPYLLESINKKNIDLLKIFQYYFIVLFIFFTRK